MHWFSFILENLQEIKEEFSKINSLNWWEFKYLNLNLEKKLKK
jgi:hypothetical protein